MKLSTRSAYGMRALVEIALVSGNGPVSAALIAKRQDLSVAYLEQLLHRLKKEELIFSVRGPRGGYLLAKPANEITIGQVVRILDGESVVPGIVKRSVHAGALSSNGWQAGSVVDESDDESNGSNISEVQVYAQRMASTVWEHVQRRLAESLDGITLQDLCDAVRDEVGEPLDHKYVFHI